MWLAGLYTMMSVSLRGTAAMCLKQKRRAETAVMVVMLVFELSVTFKLATTDHAEAVTFIHNRLIEVQSSQRYFSRSFSIPEAQSKTWRHPFTMLSPSDSRFITAGSHASSEFASPSS